MHLRRSTTVQPLRCALPPPVGSPLRQFVTGSSSVCRDRITKALGSRRQAAAASGAPSFDPSRPVGSDDGRKRTHGWEL